jgi:RPA family protein
MSQNADLSQESYKRQTATIVQISDIHQSTYVRQEGWEPNYINTPFGEKITKVNIVGIVVEPPIVLENMNQFSCTIDDGSGKIQIRAFEKIDIDENELKLEVGKPILVIGKPREYNNVYYILPQIIRPITKDIVELRNKELDILESKRTRKPKAIQIERQATTHNTTQAPNNHEQQSTESENTNYLSDIPPEDLDFATAADTKFNTKDNVRQYDSDEDNNSTTTDFDITVDDELDNNTTDAKNAPALLTLIDELDRGDGVLLEEIAIRVENADEKITKLLLHGEIYEIRPGRVKVLK